MGLRVFTAGALALMCILPLGLLIVLWTLCHAYEAARWLWKRFRRR